MSFPALIWRSSSSGTSHNMEYLILAPPVITPAEPPSGAFLLASAMRARGIDAGFMDLSLLFFRRIFDQIPDERGQPPVGRALDYFTSEIDGFDPHQHRTYSGVLNSALQRFIKGFPGWRLTLMDAIPPCDPHSPLELLTYFSRPDSRHPFQGLWQDALTEILKEMKPKKVLISISYLSQLPAAVDLHRFLVEMRQEPVVGGSLPNSLARTGKGFEQLDSVFPRILTGDGSELIGIREPALSDLVWPRMLTGWSYLCPRPVIPYALSTGCFWNRCLFCPDRGSEYYRIPLESLRGFSDSIPSALPGGRPLIHFLDSAIPPAALTEVLPVIRDLNASFYGFLRPSEDLLASDILPDLAENGCLMLQMGVESGSRELLDLFDKGLDPGTSLEVLERVSDSGIRTYVYMLLGLPGETVTDRSKTAALLDKAGNAIDFLNISVFNLPRSCELVEKAAEFGMIVTDFDAPEHAIRLYSPFTCEGVSPRDSARKFIRNDLSVRPHVMRALKNTPKWFRGAHMAMMDLPGRKGPAG